MNTKQPTAPPPHQRFRAMGFTLIEVLTVITIIAVLMAAGAIGLGNLKAGKGTSTAVASCESLFEEARTIAVSKNCRARIMVDARSNEASYLRRVVVVRQEINSNGEPIDNSWVLTSRGYEMPQGTYFSQKYSDVADGSAPAASTVSMKSEAGLNMAGYNGQYFIYEFNGQGIFEAAGSSFVVGAGRPPTSANPPKTTGSDARDFAGFVIWRNGRTSAFRNPEQIPNLPSGSSTFDF